MIIQATYSTSESRRYIYAKCAYRRLFRITTHTERERERGKRHEIHNAAGIVNRTTPSCIQCALPMHSIVVFRNKLSQPPPPSALYIIFMRIIHIASLV